MPALTPEVLEFVSQPNPAVMATVAPDGRPVTVQIVYLAQDAEHILLSIAAGNSRGGRLGHLRADPRTSITILGRDDWTKAVTIQGTAVEFLDDENLVIIDAMTTHYFGGPYAKRDKRTAVRVWIEDWSAEIDNSDIFRATPHPEDQTVA
ncbi:pyridoxamine 5'-phosphate oxidase family protein [Arthrobacter globiformis]|uniref:pyridoxamine 5'-phosphate oxidase family protein n=1 Tax=Arthrobacter globiformis TaxID=1665 RepID=UPI00278DFD88|nr:pyridoxamine 5'-phosphate oxidase family protein [Arthrobacter globiformis]MDQ0618166.1 pyridoxine/pyridoxamine 5'-phosphate oxidase [Arthrobacter globiformis]